MPENDPHHLSETGDGSASARQLPEWAPAGAGREFACEVKAGVKGGHDGFAESPSVRVSKKSERASNSSEGASNPSEGVSGRTSGKGKALPRPRRAKRATLSVEDYVAGIRAGNRAILARAITLIESLSPGHREQAKEVLAQLQGEAGKSLRVGITGVPGAGKSTFIEALGMQLIERGHRVAVLAVDPSSTRSGGSILGDKTRMEHLSRDEAAFIRPSPSGGTLGGVARKSRETLLLCEAAGYDIVLVETVGVGQSEVVVRSMVDFFLLILLAGAGDELQGIKKGVVELADAIVINKADGDNLPRARAARAEMERVVHFLQPATEGWETPALAASALTGTGLPEVWATVERFAEVTKASGLWERRRREQNVAWLRSLIEEQLLAAFREHPEVKERLPRGEREVALGQRPATEVATELARLFFEDGSKH